MSSVRQFIKAALQLPSHKVSLASTPKRNVHMTADTLPLYRSVSCPQLREKYLDDRTQFQNDSWLKARSITNFAKPAVIEVTPVNVSSVPKPDALRMTSKADIYAPSLFDALASAGCPCPCPCPCGPCGPCGTCCGNMTDCNCGRLLPPPCNTPPKCIQYMQGYYYYPYGTWFCGPYHVNTGAVAVCGPVCPGTSCGIAPPNPNALCNCPPCTCGLLSCSICNPASSGPSTPGMPWGNTNPNITSFYGPPTMPSPQSCSMFGGQEYASSALGFSMPCSQGPATQGSLPCTQQSWGAADHTRQGLPPIPFAVPGSTIQSHGTGYHVSFPPPSAGTLQTVPTSTNLPGPAVPEWTSQRVPCKYTDNLIKNANMTQAANVDTPTVMQSIIEPFTKVFPAAKEPKDTSPSSKKPRKYCNILQNPKVKASFP